MHSWPHSVSSAALFTNSNLRHPMKTPYKPNADTFIKIEEREIIHSQMSHPADPPMLIIIKAVKIPAPALSPVVMS